MADEQDIAEELDLYEMVGDTLADRDPVELVTPPDRPLGSDRYGVTTAEEELGEPLSERIHREIPDPLARELDRAARDTEPAVSRWTAGHRDEVGLVIDLEEGSDLTALESDDLSERSAEEAAMHYVDEG